MDPSQKPFDALQICNSEAYVVIMFYQKRRQKIMYWVDVDDFVLMMETCGRKSATEKMIEEICYKKYSFTK